MKLQPIINLQTNIRAGNFATYSSTPEQKVVNFGSSHPMPVADYGKSWLYWCQMDKLKNETKQFPEDIAYREALLKNAGLPSGNQHYLRAIVGPQEINKILKDFDSSEEFFSVGKNDENILNHKMRANLHMHTIASDGSLTPQQLLDKAAEYADKVAEKNPKSKLAPFVVGITDHDTTESAKEAIKIIYKDPQKYRNLRVILGVEMTTFNKFHFPKVKEPVNIHTLVYGIDPNEKSFNGFIEGIKEEKSAVAEKMVFSAEKAYRHMTGVKRFFDLNEGKRLYNPLSKSILGIYNNVENYAKNKMALQHIVLQDEEFVNALKSKGMPTKIDGLMYKMNEFYKPLTGNNKVLPPEQTLPMFLSISTGLEQDKIELKLSEGLNSPKYKSLEKGIMDCIQPYKITMNSKHEYVPTITKVYEGLKGQPKAIMGLAHPIDYLKSAQSLGEKFDFINTIYARFIREGKEKAKFSEVYYQSYKPSREEFKNNPMTKSLMSALSELYGLVKTGSADSHGMSVFKRL